MIFERFSAICEEERSISSEKSDWIGIYNEKRLHRILKRLVSENSSAYEIPVGRFVADVLTDGHITEIQTGRLSALLPKLKYYAEETDYTVTVIFPIVREKTILRIDTDTGEVLRKRKSGTHGTPSDILPQLYGLREIFPCDRISYCALLVDAEEHRYSEAIRYRKAGRYDCELFPTELIEIKDISGVGDLLPLIPHFEGGISVAEYGKLRKRKGRNLYSELNFLVSVGLLRREREGKKYIFYKTYS